MCSGSHINHDHSTSRSEWKQNTPYRLEKREPHYIGIISSGHVSGSVFAGPWYRSAYIAVGTLVCIHCILLVYEGAWYNVHHARSCALKPSVCAWYIWLCICQLWVRTIEWRTVRQQKVTNLQLSPRRRQHLRTWTLFLVSFPASTAACSWALLGLPFSTWLTGTTLRHDAHAHVFWRVGFKKITTDKRSS